jgi:hypothetical protein
MRFPKSFCVGFCVCGARTQMRGSHIKSAQRSILRCRGKGLGNAPGTTGTKNFFSRTSGKNTVKPIFYVSVE